tara:strand:+ start:15401 stop:16294 length:894 start_codon:yes stop_codon:yes gene_type:complete
VTPLEYSSYYSDISGAEVWLKLENLQVTGSFKARGAFNKTLSLNEYQKSVGCVTASSGNHGAASANAMKELEITGLVFLPEKTSSIKVDAIKRAGCEVRFFGKDGVDTEIYARQYAFDNNLTFLSPYNDEEVIAGQGTCGKEIIDCLPDCDAVFVAVGGGGLISGIAGYMKSKSPNIDIIGCQPEASAVMAHSIDSGKIIEIESNPTLSDGTAGGIEKDAITFDLCKNLVDYYELISEKQIVENIQTFIDTHRMLIEGAAAVALAGFLANKERYVGKKVVVVVCGGNIARKTLASII